MSTLGMLRSRGRYIQWTHAQAGIQEQGLR